MINNKFAQALLGTMLALGVYSCQENPVYVEEPQASAWELPKPSSTWDDVVAITGNTINRQVEGLDFFLTYTNEVFPGKTRLYAQCYTPAKEDITVTIDLAATAADLEEYNKLSRYNRADVLATSGLGLSTTTLTIPKGATKSSNYAQVIVTDGEQFDFKSLYEGHKLLTVVKLKSASSGTVSETFTKVFVPISYRQGSIYPTGSEVDHLTEIPASELMLTSSGDADNTSYLQAIDGNEKTAWVLDTQVSQPYYEIGVPNGVEVAGLLLKNLAGKTFRTLYVQGYDESKGEWVDLGRFSSLQATSDGSLPIEFIYPVACPKIRIVIPYAKHSVYGYSNALAELKVYK